MERGFGIGPAFSLRREIDRLFEDTLSGRRSGGGTGWTPAVDVRETERELTLDFELPGIDPGHVDVSVDAGILTVRGEKREERKEGEEGRYHVIERSYGTFTRSFQLPQGVDEEQISADFDKGILSVRIPKAALPQPRRIQIGGSERGGRAAAGVRGAGSGGQGQQQVGGGTGGGSQRGRPASTRKNEQGEQEGGRRRDPMAAGGRDSEEISG
ncbi:MAG TPA: Hsp20/alpha crystallin family protein [Gemmatimonadaceae bacterium]|nr:Hsp20/alpha crystallin family protein [Gemmatimonadaceae bacterium]